MAILSKIKSAVKKVGGAISKAFSQGNTNLASVFNARQSLASPSQKIIQSSSPKTGPGISYTPIPQQPRTISGTKLGGIYQTGTLDARGGYTPTQQFSSAPQYTQDPTLPVYGTTSIKGGERPTSSDMKLTTDTAVISPFSVASSTPSGSISGGVTDATTSSSAPSVGDQPTYSDPGLINNDSLIKELTSLFDYDTEKRQFVPKNTATQNQPTDSIEETLKGFLPKKENVYEDSEIQNQQAEVRRRETELQGYTSTLNSIVAKQNADLLQLRGIGSQEGVTEAVYGGQAATINREAAIKALPVQAQIASAQGNLQLAQDYLGQLTTWKQEEISSNYEYKKGLYDLIRERVTGAEKRQLDKIEKDETRSYNTQQDNLKFVQGLAKTAFDNGERDIASRLMTLMQDPSAPNFMENAQKEAGKSKVSTTGVISDNSEFVKTLQPNQAVAFKALSDLDQSNVSQLLSGDVLLSDLMASRGIQGSTARQELLNKARSVDPTFSENTNKIRYEYKKNWNLDAVKGNVGTKTAINTALGHLADLKEASQALPKSTISKLNSVENILNKEFGDPAVTNFRIVLDALGTELARTYKGGVPNEGEIENWKKNLAESFSQQQFDGAFNTTSKLLSSKLTALRYGYKTAMGTEYNQTLIDPDKRQALIAAGIDVNKIAKENIGVQTPLQIQSTPENESLLSQFGL